MVVSRLLAAALALFVSPLGAAVCEIACRTPVHAAMHSAPTASDAVAADSHQHHHEAELEDVAASASALSRLDAPPRVDCDPVNSVPARVRGAFSDTPALADAGQGAPAAWTAITSSRHAAAPSPPSSPPHHAPVPLRI